MLLKVVDLETTGVENAAICEIGWTVVRTYDSDPPEVGDPGSMLINPGRPIPPEARGVHHISDVDVKDAPSADAGFLELMAGPPDAFVAHVAKFERVFFGGGAVPWICTRKVAMRLWPTAPDFKNQTLRYFLGIDDLKTFDQQNATPPHRAGPDTYITAHILAAALARESIAQLIAWSNEPSLLPGVINFGTKQKGVLWSKADSGYLEWIARTQDMDEDKKFTAKYWLDRRRSDDR